MPENEDLVWIQMAAFEFSRSRDWLDDQIRQGNLKRYSIPGDRRVYVSRTEIRELLKPQEGR